MTPTEEAIRECVKEELAVAIAQGRGGEGAGILARSVLSFDSKAFLLLGLTEGARKAVYYDSTMWGIQFVSIEDTEGKQRRGLDVDKRKHRSGAESFVLENLEGFDWLHPRVRRVAELVPETDFQENRLLKYDRN